MTVDEGIEALDNVYVSKSLDGVFAASLVFGCFRFWGFRRHGVNQLSALGN